jgi:hypothetical protein
MQPLDSRIHCELLVSIPLPSSAANAVNMEGESLVAAVALALALAVALAALEDLNVRNRKT